MFISAFSLPEDIKSKTIYTIVTKPVRATEIVLGRMIGFVAVGTVMLMPMGLVSFIFVDRGLNHRHYDLEVDVKVVDSPGATRRALPTTSKIIGTSSKSCQGEASRD